MCLAERLTAEVVPSSRLSSRAAILLTQELWLNHSNNLQRLLKVQKQMKSCKSFEVPDLTELDGAIGVCTFVFEFVHRVQGVQRFFGERTEGLKEASMYEISP